MSDYEYYEGLEGAGDDGTHNGPDSLYSEAPGGDHDNDNFTYEDAQWGPDEDVHGETTEAEIVEAADNGPDPGDEEFSEVEEPGDGDPADGTGLLDGLEFDLSNLDLGSLTDMAFDATYDLIGSDPGEQGWWADLASDNNHDGAYETVSADDSYLAF
jgi:hypothetical protein